ncbi:unnamed protein product [Rotaria magnacalcarata]|uniref:Uncharacterized protein n=1 Tax=Rotaria magnacalcarata TaxID=392030 RepID=A0A816YQ32_9BILA|nr:unnamed protein product [Rotaria magnacalcarata]CAF1615240.1 unnamed protein product [Rotaria magnacalcarata]CAF2137194.1 unnamed protein product [Rotaria magnacalcarata]CAF2151524.1 unnamed protein product [Rotaria magnacalcarata]CAF2170271.1 unnamed protein product [Rotaria magnacalcarata]
MLQNSNDWRIGKEKLSHTFLSCTHAFCNEWFQKSSASVCPICYVNTMDDSGFVLTARPTYNNVKIAITKSILELPTGYDTI